MFAYGTNRTWKSHRRMAAVGGIADMPRTWRNERGQLLFTMIYPSGLDGFFEEISRSGLDPATQLPDINHIAAKYQLEIVGPPLE